MFEWFQCVCSSVTRSIGQCVSDGGLGEDCRGHGAVPTDEWQVFSSFFWPVFQCDLLLRGRQFDVNLVHPCSVFIA